MGLFKSVVLYCVTQLSNSCLTILELITVVIMKAVLETELVGFGTTNGVVLLTVSCLAFPSSPSGKPPFFTML